MKWYVLLLSTILLMASSCTKDDSKYPNADEKLYIYFDRFIDEANARGIEVDLTDIDGYVADIINPGTIGLCQYNDEENNEITIDKKYWNENDDLFREFVVFHELGHCKLFRDHLENEDSDGFCVSIMASGLGGCDENYSIETREAYLDELFQ